MLFRMEACVEDVWGAVPGAVPGAVLALARDTLEVF